MDERIKELTLLLLYLTAWEEKDFENEKYLRSWKGYDFDILNELSGEGLIESVSKAKLAA